VSNTTADAENLAIAQRLAGAWRNAGTTEPPSGQLDGLDDARARQIARRAVELLGPERVVGYKVGLTLASAQQALDYDRPIFGRIYAEDVFPCGAGLSRPGFINPKIEPECGLVIGSRLGGADVTTEQARRTVDGVVPAFEIADSRYGVEAATVGDLIADNGAGAGAVVTLSDAVPAAQIDLGAVRVTVEVDGHAVCLDSPMAGGASNDRPYELVAWLARELAAQQLYLEPGQFVLTGSWIKPIGVTAAVRVHASYSGLGTVGMDMS
jgi:2-keto-4-pentenoate hydratase